MLAGLGIVAMWLRELPVKVARWGQHFFVHAGLRQPRGLLFPTLIDFMNSREALRQVNNFTVRAVPGLVLPEPARRVAAGRPAGAAVSPGEGFHVFWLDGRLMWMKREVQVAVSVIEKIRCPRSAATSGRWRRSSTRRCTHRIERELNRIAIYVPSPYNNEWSRARLGNNRKLDSVVLKEGGEGGHPRRS